MKFGDKVHAARKAAKMTQGDLAKAVGLSVGAICNYETNGAYPRTREGYKKLADALGVQENYLRTEDEDFVLDAREQFGSRGAKQALNLIADAQGLFAGGELSDRDKEAVMKALQAAYLQTKPENIEKYTPNKYKTTAE